MRALDSVIAFAHFELNSDAIDRAKNQLLHENDWQTWINQIELHGLSGFAYRHITAHDLVIPEQVFSLLEQLKARHTGAAQMRYQALSEITAKFRAEKIPVVALKGAALAPYLYKTSYLRPMRDMDLLVPREKLYEAEMAMRELGYNLPAHQPSRFMRSLHQLPNATKSINGMISSVEIHHDGISREVPGHYFYPDDSNLIQPVKWHDLTFSSLDDVSMLHQVSRHLEGLHSGAVLKLINVMDVIGLAKMLVTTEKWEQVEVDYPHVVNTLRCLHLLTPLPNELIHLASRTVPAKQINGVGQIMGSLRRGVKEQGIKRKLKALLRPSDWWMHLHYNRAPHKSLFTIKWVRHPLRVLNWFVNRLISFLFNFLQKGGPSKKVNSHEH